MELIQLIEDKTACIGIIGLGYVGLPLLLRFIEAGYKTLGFDIDKNKINLLKQGKSYIQHIGAGRVAEAFQTGRLAVTDNLQQIGEVDTIIICLPTPLGKHHEPDLSYVIDTVDKMAPYLRSGQVVSLESTTYPGTTEEEVRPRIERQGLVVGEDVYLVYSPEREDPGNAKYITQTIPKLVGGTTEACLKIGMALYGAIVDQPVPVSSTKVAEMAKLLENIYRAVNIGLVNELKMVADRMDINIWEVIAAAASKPFGFTPFYPGPGLGGHCIPIDPFYLTWKAKEYGLHTRFIELAGQVNTAMPQWVVSKVTEALNERKKSVNGAKVLVLGVAYKKDIDDLRESPALEIIELLQLQGAEVTYSDPHILALPKTRKYNLQLTSIEVTEETLSTSDCVVLVTNHSDFDYNFLQQHSQLIIDTRGQYPSNLENVVSA